MISLVMLILISLCQLIIGSRFIEVFKTHFDFIQSLLIGYCCGVGIFSLIPFALQLLHVPVSPLTVLCAIGIPALYSLVTIQWRQGIRQIKALRLRPRLYQIPQMIVIAALIFISMWRCYYLPPTPRDLTSGAEVIAEYAVKEHSLINSVFQVDLSTTNNQFKPPFISSLQVIYKLGGLAFGQFWLATLVLSFIIFLYREMSLRIHSLIAGTVIIFFLAIPELYAYSFMALYDYPNAIFLTLSLFCAFRFIEDRKSCILVLSGFLFMLATYARSETLILGGFLFLPLFWSHIQRRDRLASVIKSGACFLLPAVLIYLLSVKLYINNYLPAQYKVEALVNPHLLNPGPLLDRFADMNNELIFSENGILYYGYFIGIYLAITILDTIAPLTWTKGSAYWFASITILYFGIPFLGYLFPLMDLNNSTKRALFKLFPLMMISLAFSPILQHLSQKIRTWERS